MNLLDKNKVIQIINRYKIVAILRGVPEEKMIPLCQALYDGGIRILELTFGGVSDLETAKNIKMLTEYFKEKLCIGAGTVLTKHQVALTKSAGGMFIISPNTDQKIIKSTVKKGLVSIPGALTPSEVCRAKAYGADFVKLFPIKNLGVNYIKAIKAPLSTIKILAVGGIDQNNMIEFLNSGVSGFGVGSNITDKQMIDNNDWAGITALAKKYTTVIDNV